MPKFEQNQTAQRRNRQATFIAYLRFCQNTPMYPDSLANQLRLFDWIEQRRIEMLADGRPHWVPTEWDYWQAMRDCWDDLVGRNSKRHGASSAYC